MPGQAPPPKRIDVKSIIALGLTGGALVLEPVSGVASLIARFAALGAFWVNDQQLRSVTNRVASLEERVTALEDLRLPLQRIAGSSLRLLAMCVDRESTALFQHVEADEAIAVLGITGQEYVEAAEDLRDFGLVVIDHNGNHATGIGRTRLVASAFIGAAPALLPDVDLSEELGAVLDQLRTITPEKYRLSVSEMLVHTGIPVARLELMLKGLEGLGFIKGQGPGGYEYGSSLTIELTSSGRRLLRT